MHDLRLIRSPMCGFLAMGTFWGSWSVVIPAIVLETGASDGRLGLILLCASAGALPAMWATGRALGRGVGSGVAVPLAAGALALSIAALALAPGTAGIAVTLAFAGASAAAMDVAMNAEVGRIERRSGRSLMQLAHGMFAVAYLVAALVVGALRDALGDPGATRAPALLIAALGVALLAALSQLSRDRTGTGLPPAAAAGVSGLPAPVTLLLGMAVFVAFLSENALQSWSALRLERGLLADPLTGSLGPAAIGLATAVGRLGAHALGRRIGMARVMALAVLFAVTGVAGFALAPGVPLALAALLAGAAGIAVIAPEALARAAAAAPAGREGPAVAAAGLIGYSGFFVGPPLMGAVAGAISLPAALLCVAVGLCAVLPLLASAARRAPPVRG